MAPKATQNERSYMPNNRVIPGFFGRIETAPGGAETPPGGLTRSLVLARKRLPTMVPENSPALLARFWAKVDTSGGPDACWPWTGYVDEKTNGYGHFRDGQKLSRAHRFGYKLAHGPVPAGLVVDHTCHNNSGCTDVPCFHRRCCNPRHLEATTQSINSIRGRSGDHQLAKTHCPSGHPYSVENTIIRSNGRQRVCRECNRAAQARYNAKRKAA